MRRAALAVIALLVLATFPEWGSGIGGFRYWESIVRDTLVFGIYALSLDLLVGRAGMPSLGHAAFFGSGAYGAAIAAARLGTDELLVTLGAAVAVAALLALVIGFLSVRASGIFFLMLTLAFAQMVYAIAFQWFDVTGGSNGLSGVRRPVLFGLDLGSPDALFRTVVATFGLTLVFLAALQRSHYGRALAGLRDNERRMRALGYHTFRLRLSAFVLAGSLAGAAGALSTWSFLIVSPFDVGIGRSLEAFVMVLIGGAGSLLGPVVGAVVVVYVDRILSSSTGYSQTVLGLAFVIFVLAARQGIVGLVRDLASKARR